MPAYAFDARIVLARTDLKGTEGPLPLDAAMDAVQRAVAAIPGVDAIDICYLGNRVPRIGRVHVRPHDANDRPGAGGHWHAFLCREVERHTDQALAGLARKVAA